MYRLVCAVALAALTSPAMVLAQHRWPVTVEIYLGPTWGTSEDNQGYRGSRNGTQADLLMGRRLHPRDRAGLFMALDAGVRGINTAIDADCLLAPDGGCVPWFPGLGGASLLVGWESRSTNVRFLAGPGITSAEYDRTFGLVSRFDVALPLLWHISAMATLNGLWVPSWKGDRFFYGGIGAGLRIR